jgi:hypothetical protein
MMFLGQELKFPQLGRQTPTAITLPYGVETETSWLTFSASAGYQELVPELLSYRSKYNPDDWLFYQLIRKTAA